MDSSTQEPDSRTAAISRKRKQPTSLRVEQHVSDSDKRQKLIHSNHNESRSRRSSTGCGESSTSASTSRSASDDPAASADNQGVKNLGPQRAAGFGWTPVNAHDPFVNSHQAHTDRSAVGDYVDGPTFVGKTEVDDPILDKLLAHEMIEVEEYQVMARWLEQNDLKLNVRDLQHQELENRVSALMDANSLAGQSGITKVLELLSKGGDYHRPARAFLKERYSSVRTRSLGLADATVSGHQNTQLSFKAMAKWLVNHDTGPKLHDIKNGGLRRRVSDMMQERGLEKGFNTAKILAHITNEGSWSFEAGELLKAYYESALDSRNDFPTDGLQPNGTTAPLDYISDVEEDEDANFTGLLRFEDITKKPFKALRGRIKNLASDYSHKSAEELAREVVFLKTDCHKKATSFLTNFYQSHKISGPRNWILEDMSRDHWSLDDLAKVITHPSGFLRPLIASDIIERASETKFPAVVINYMHTKPESSFATGILEIARQDFCGVSARQCLTDFVIINYVGGDQDTSIHSRDGLEDLIPMTSAKLKISRAETMQKLHSTRPAALSLDELDSLLPKPTGPFEQGAVAKAAQKKEYTSEMWKWPNRPFHHRVARELLRLARAGKRLPAAREHLDRFVEALYFSSAQSNRAENLHMAPGAGQQLSKDLTPKLHINEEVRLMPMSRAAAAVPSLNSDHGTSVLRELEHFISDPSAFWRPMRKPDLGSNPWFVNEVESIRETHGMRLEDALLYLISNDRHTHVALTSLVQYIDKTHRMIRPTQSFDDGEMARETAAHGDLHTSVTHTDEKRQTTEMFTLSDTLGERNDSDDFEVLQRRYFQITDFNSLVRCLCCGTEGHMQESCPSRTCAHCGTVDDHFSGACPTNNKCGRCRQRGHTTTTCKALSSSIMQGLNSSCDLCGRIDHVEEECSELWRSSMGDDEIIHLISRQEMHLSCYSCGANSRMGHSYAHWGDDCPNSSAWVRSAKSLNPTFSKKHADKYIEGHFTNQQQPATYGSVPSYQLAMLVD